jgi:hypothetical protein
MRRSAIILSILFLASTAGAQLPYAYHCQYENDIEHEICSFLAAAMVRSVEMVEAEDTSRPHFFLIVLPTERGGYISVTIASNFFYPPLNGLVLSVYIGGFIVEPDIFNDEVADNIMGGVALETAKWMIREGDNLLGITFGTEDVGLYAMIGGGDE